MLLNNCGGRDEEAQQAGQVNPADYSEFYLWSGVKAPPAVERAKSVYFLWGELRIENSHRIIPLLGSVPRANPVEKWLVVRAERLDWSEDAFVQLLSQAKKWQAAGSLTGIQVDFDSSTGGLGNYAAFLADLRGRLPANVKLSATGLMDWPANASQHDLAALRAALDEIVIQTYRETTTIPDYRRYLAATRRLKMPFKVALVEGGEWKAPDHLSADPGFRGYVVFLLREGSVQPLAGTAPR